MVFSNSINNDTINGTLGDDNLTGGTGGNILIGLEGNDTLTGGTGGNNLSGGAGDDIITGGTGSNNLNGGAGNDSLTGGSGSNTLTGETGNDTLVGGSGGNNFDGGEDDDYLVNGTGNNNLRGGSGTDTFFFSKVESIGSNSIYTDGGTVIIDGEVITEDGVNETISVNAIADFNTLEGDKIQLDANSFEVTPGDTSTLSFDNNTRILSLGDEPVVEVANGVDFDVLANTEIVANSGANNSSANNGDSTDEFVDVYRFFETERGFHFYTSSEAERDTILQQIENGELSYSYEGEAFTALAEDDDGDPLTGAKPVYRFFNDRTGAHLYTISQTEKDNIVDNLPDYNLEGVAYYAYDTPQENTIPLYRLYNSETGTHFFTPSAAERDSILDTLPQYGLENEAGIAFHVLPVEL